MPGQARKQKVDCKEVHQVQQHPPQSFLCPNPHCGLAIHHDINAAHNMLIMNLAVLKDILESSRNATAQIVRPVS